MALEESIHRKILQLASKLRGYEIVPGLPISDPTFDRGWLAHAEELLSDHPPFPPSFRSFVQDVGAVQAIDVAGGLAFFSAEQIIHHVTQDYGSQLTAVDEVPTFPFAADASGQYFLLAYDDSAVWKTCPRLPGTPTPRQLSDGFGAYLKLVVEDWRAMLDGKGTPFRAS